MTNSNTEGAMDMMHEHMVLTEFALDFYALQREHPEITPADIPDLKLRAFIARDLEKAEAFNAGLRRTWLAKEAVGELRNHLRERGVPEEKIEAARVAIIKAGESD